MTASTIKNRRPQGRGAAHAWASIVLGLALAGCAAPSEAPPTIRTASDLTEADQRAKLRMELAAAYFSRGQITTALDEVKQALVARPDLPEAYNLRALIYASMEQPALADESFRRALQLAPADGAAMNNYGWFLCQRGRFAEAETMFDRAIALPQYRDLARTLMAKGVCEARAGDLLKAEASLVKAVEVDPANPSIAFNLAEILYRRGEFERARFYIRRVNAQPENVNAQTLWLAARIEHKLGNRIGANGIGVQLRQRYPDSPQSLRFERGQFDD